MTKPIRAVLDEPTLIRLDEPVALPPHARIEVTINPIPAQELEERTSDPFLDALATVRVDAPADFSLRWREYVAVRNG